MLLAYSKGKIFNLCVLRTWSAECWLCWQLPSQFSSGSSSSVATSTYLSGMCRQPSQLPQSPQAWQMVFAIIRVSTNQHNNTSQIYAYLNLIYLFMLNFMKLCLFFLTASMNSSSNLEFSSFVVPQTVGEVISTGLQEYMVLSYLSDLPKSL